MPDTAFRSMIETLPGAFVWATNREGVVVIAGGGGLRLLGLAPEAVEGAPIDLWGPRARRWHAEALEGRHGTERGGADDRASGGRVLVTSFGPYYREGRVAGMVAVSVDVTLLENEAIAAIENKLGAWEPWIRTLTEREAERIASAAELARARARREEAEAARRWTVATSLGTWIGERAGYATTAVLTAIALWIAARLGVLDVLIGQR